MEVDLDWEVADLREHIKAKLSLDHVGCVKFQDRRLELYPRNGLVRAVGIRQESDSHLWIGIFRPGSLPYFIKDLRGAHYIFF
jgi:hypothetical protein